MKSVAVATFRRTDNFSAQRIQYIRQADNSCAISIGMNSNKPWNGLSLPTVLTPVTYQPTSSSPSGGVLRQIAANLAGAIGFLAVQDKILRGVFSLFFDGSHAGCRFHPRCEHATPRCAEEPPLALMEIAPGHEVIG